MRPLTVGWLPATTLEWLQESDTAEIAPTISQTAKKYSLISLPPSSIPVVDRSHVLAFSHKLPSFGAAARGILHEPHELNVIAVHSHRQKPIVSVEGGGKLRRWSAKNCDAELISDLLSAFLSTPNLYFSLYGSNWQRRQFLFHPGLAQTVALPVGLNDMTSVG